MAEGKPIIVHEARTEGEEVVLTGRQVHLPADFPLFASMGEVGKQIIENGQMALRTEEFEPIFDVVKKANDMLAAEQAKKTNPTKMVVASHPQAVKPIFKVYSGGKSSDGSKSN